MDNLPIIEQKVEILPVTKISPASHDSLQKYRSKYVTLTNTQPHNFEIVDKIYKNELTQTTEKLKLDNSRKLRILNRTIQDRIQKGTETINTRLLEEDQNSEKERKNKAKKRIQSNLEKVKKEFDKQMKEKETQSII